MMTIKERIEEKKETGLKDFEGLCVTCKNSKSCIFLQNSTKSIISCEEFENVETTVEKTKGDLKENFVSKVKGYDLKIGLCANCENKIDCKFEKPESGVWHCEEYR
ncbi:MAG: hypothetical protein ABIN39_06225 [candidate division WOR-3 bacterium]